MMFVGGKKRERMEREGKGGKEGEKKKQKGWEREVGYVLSDQISEVRDHIISEVPVTSTGPGLANWHWLTV